MAGYIYADYDLIERCGETETTALFKGSHVVIPERLRAVKMAQRASQKLKATFKPERLKELFGQLCQQSAKVARALDTAEPHERSAAERIAFIETIHFDAAKAPDGDDRDYIVTEWVTGGTLADKLAAGALPVDEAVSIVTRVLEALEFLHSRDLVHGNLKPSNILLTPSGDPRIADFGANILGEGMPPRLGSIAYLSPEQLECGSVLDGSSDLFSLTLILYELLTGRRVPRLMTSEQMPSRVKPGPRPTFDAVILRGLQDVPTLRFRSARDMRERILECLSAPQTTGRAEAVAAETTLPKSVLSEAVAEPVEEDAGEPAGDQAPENGGPEPVVAVSRRAGDRRINEVDGAELIWVPGGTLTMGGDRTDDEKPTHTVEIAGFWCSKYPVTQDQYLRFVRHVSGGSGADISTGSAPDPSVLRPPALFKRGDANAKKAAAGVSWAEACRYAAWAGVRLPTEAEWEWVARGPEARIYPWGNQWEETRANTAESGLFEQTYIDRYSSGASWCGIVDLMGNVLEWCSTLYMPYPYNPADGREDQKIAGKRVLRGGSTNNEGSVTTACTRFVPSSRATMTGIRVVVNP